MVDRLLFSVFMDQSTKMAVWNDAGISEFNLYYDGIHIFTVFAGTSSTEKNG